MKRPDTPRRKRAQMKAWVYLALFGPDEDTDEPTGDSIVVTSGEGDTNDGHPPEE